MHLAEGVLSLPALAATASLAVAGVAIGLKRLEDSRLPLAALLGSAFLVAGAIHVPLGVGSVHLLLNGLAGLLLGWAAFPVLLAALLLQAALFGFGGFAVLGANLLIMAVPAVLAHYLLRGLASDAAPWRLRLAGALAGVIGVGGAGALAAVVLTLGGGREFAGLAALFGAAHLPVLALDAALGAVALPALARLVPDFTRRGTVEWAR
ncbi:MAG: cobalt transporter CbiM [Pseudomonadota bacterium]